MANTINLNAEVGANYIGDDAQPALTFSNTGAGSALRLEKTPGANASVAVLELSVNSVASAAAIGLLGDSFVSVTSILFTTGGVAGTGAIRVIRTDGTLGWIPVLPNAAVTAVPKG